ncbi:MAG: phosphoribosylglycinamide formyltransferase [FCB group bacterium]|nr:phosphoribosylglycinamide formyltransferase [FCB group bacterium]
MTGISLKNIAVFASGNGSNFRAIHQAVTEGDIPGRIGLLVSDNPDCRAVTYARENRIKAEIINFRHNPGTASPGQVLTHILAALPADLVVLAGFMKMIPDSVVQAYKNRILNIHPALLPRFGGRGFYGRRVHEAVIASGAKLSGPTVHFVDEIYDHGPILAQIAVPVLAEDTAESLAKRVLKVEHRLYPEAVKAFCEERIFWKNNIPFIRN